MGEFDIRGTELKKLLKLARKQSVFFAFSPGTSPKEDYFGLHKRKPAKAIFKKAKEEGPSKKGAFGTAHIEGKLLCLTCDRELPALAKKLKKYLKSENIRLNVQVLGPGGVLLEEDIEELPDEEDDIEDVAVPKEDAPGTALGLETAPLSEVVATKTPDQPTGDVKPPLEALSDAYSDLGTRIEIARTSDEKLARQVTRLSNEFLASVEKGKEGTAKQFLDMLKSELAKVPQENLVSPSENFPIFEDKAEASPIQTEAEEKSPLEKLADTYADLSGQINALSASDDKLAQQVSRLSDKFLASVEEGKEGKAKQFLDMLAAELAKAPRYDEPTPREAAADFEELAEETTAPTEAVEKSPMETLADTFTSLGQKIEIAKAGDEKLAQQVTRLSDKFLASAEEGKEGKAKQFLDMLNAELAKVSQSPLDQATVPSPGGETPETNGEIPGVAGERGPYLETGSPVDHEKISDALVSRLNSGQAAIEMVPLPAAAKDQLRAALDEAKTAAMRGEEEVAFGQLKTLAQKLKGAHPSFTQYAASAPLTAGERVDTELKLDEETGAPESETVGVAKAAPDSEADTSDTPGEDYVPLPPPVRDRMAYGPFKVAIEKNKAYNNQELFEIAYQQYLKSKGRDLSREEVRALIEKSGTELQRYSDGSKLAVEATNTKDFIEIDIVPLGVTSLTDDDARDMREMWNRFSPDQQRDINARTDKKFYNLVDYEGKIRSPEESAAKAWHALRTQEILNEAFSASAVGRATPFKALGGRNFKLSADNVKTAQIIANYAGRLTHEEMVDFWSRHDTETMSIDDLNVAIRGYYSEMSRRRKTHEEYGKSHHTLVGRDKIIGLYAKAHSMDNMAQMEKMALEFIDPERMEEVKAARKALEAAILEDPQILFDGMIAASLDDYGEKLVTEAVAETKGRIDRRQAELSRFRREVLYDENIARLYDKLGDVRKIRATIDARKRRPNPVDDAIYRAQNPDLPPPYDLGSEGNLQEYSDNQKMMAFLANLAKEDNTARAVLDVLSRARADDSAEKKVIVILGRSKSPRELASKLRGFLDSHSEALEDVRGQLEEDPDRILKFPGVVEGVMAQNGIRDDGAHAEALKYYRTKIEDEEAEKEGLITASAIVLGLLTFGGGTLAIFAGAGAVAVSGYGASEAVGSYQDDKAAFMAGISKVDPGLTWVVISIAGLGLDAFGFGKALKGAAKGIALAEDVLSTSKPVGKALKKYADDLVETENDVLKIADPEKLDARLDALRDELSKSVGKSGLSGQGLEAIMQAARREGQINLALNSIRGGASGGDLLNLGIDDLARKLTPSVTYLRMGGVQHVDGFLRSNAAKTLFPDLANYSPGQIQRLKDAWLAATQKGDDLIAKARNAGQTDDDIAHAMGQWARDPDMSHDRFLSMLAPNVDEASAALKVTELQVDEAYEALAKRGLPPDSKTGTVGLTPSDDEAEVLRLFYAARENSPTREVGIMRNSQTGDYILVQGAEDHVPFPTKAELEKRLGKDHRLLKGDAWEAQNWEVPIHTHPKETASAASVPKHVRAASWEDLEVAYQNAMTAAKKTAHDTGQIVGGQAQFVVDGKTVRVLYSYDPKAKLFTYCGPVPPKGGKGPWTYEMRYFSSTEEYAREIYPKVGAGLQNVPGSTPKINSPGIGAMAKAPKAAEVAAVTTDEAMEMWKHISKAGISDIPATEAAEIMSRAKGLGLVKSDGGFTSSLDDALESWKANPNWSSDDFVDNLPYLSAQGKPVPDPITGRPSTVRREAGPVQPSGRVYNTSGKSKIVAPDEIMSPETKRVLGVGDAVHANQEIAATGAIQEIKAGNLENGAQWVEISGEPLPGHMHRGKGKPGPGQKQAPNFNAAGPSVQERIKNLGLRNPEDWERLHLWGPGMGDEAMAGIFLGPREMNQIFQKRVEGFIRELARQVAPHRTNGYELVLKARAETWGSVTPGRFEIATGERVLRKARYEVILRTPNKGTQVAVIELEVLTDPALLNAGEKMAIKTDIDSDALNALFNMLPVN